MSLAPGARFNHYEVLAKLGEGGMGEVYRALDTRLEQLPRVRPAVENPPQLRSVPRRLVELSGDRAGVAPDPVRNEAVRINVEPSLNERKPLGGTPHEPQRAAADHPAFG